jgi:hypothetical protein
MIASAMTYDYREDCFVIKYEEWTLYVNGRKYIFDNKEEGKAFYEFWQKH